MSRKKSQGQLDANPTKSKGTTSVPVTSTSKMSPPLGLSVSELRDFLKGADEKLEALPNIYNYELVENWVDDELLKAEPRPTVPPFEKIGDDVKCEYLDPSLPVQTRSGWPAVIFEIDFSSSAGVFPVSAVVYEPRHANKSTWLPDGRYMNSPAPANNDLFNVTREEWRDKITKQGYLTERL
jgi:hypothetical protein